jgi:hypothetical protein
MSEEPEITLEEHTFRLTVAQSLSRLETLAVSTDQHLKDLNGSVGRHEDRLVGLRADLTLHAVECPLRAEVEKLKQLVTADEAAAKATEKWWERISPLIWLAIGGVITLLLLNGPAILQIGLQHLTHTP